ncbi:MAG TPA: glycoside hydrolase family 43 protein [Acidimicrobiales bacterium]|nr:glycoside hydrolase family 43 protein [Acidimicrobiales bacterium]
MDLRRGWAHTLRRSWAARRALAVTTTVAGVGLAVIGVLTYANASTSSTGAGASDTGTSTSGPATAALAEPPTSSDPSTPGTWLSVGPDETDPFIVLENGVYSLFTSRAGGGANVPVRAATIPGHWGPVVDALPALPAWAQPGWAWAPDVHRFGDRYVLYFTTLLRGSSPATMCIGDAVGTKISGPFVAQPDPFICQRALGGSIDPRTFVRPDGNAFMLWKSDQNANSSTTPTQIYSQALSPDGLHLLGHASAIFAPDEAWQGTVVEAPQLWVAGGNDYLFYSGFWFNQPGYAVGVARCAGPLGPCADTSPAPLLGSNAQGSGPGEESVFSDPKGMWLLYAPFHSWAPQATPARPATAVRLGFNSAGVYLAATPSSPGAI